jgi:hypothetical protein
MLTTPSGMITVCVRDHCFLYRLPWINVEISGRAVQTLIGKLDEQVLNLSDSCKI